MIGMQLDFEPNFYLSIPVHDPKVKVKQSFLLKFWFKFMFGMMTDTSPKYFMIPSPWQYMTLESRSHS